ncbi:MAG: hypothetical protein KAS66_07570 [Candidatus Omnitrophica bacterium]|nr:hypothetical protein [Candidatus Omnitrophota bacterium]
MKNYSKVFLIVRARMDLKFMSMTDILNVGDKYSDTIFYIPADAKMDGL